MFSSISLCIVVIQTALYRREFCSVFKTETGKDCWSYLASFYKIRKLLSLRLVSSFLLAHALWLMI